MENKSKNKSASGIRIPEWMFKVGGLLGVLLLLAAAYQMWPKTATDATVETGIDNFLKQSDILFQIKPGTTENIEISPDITLNIGLDGRSAGVTKYIFSTYGTDGLSVTGFTSLQSVQEAGKHVPGDKEIIVAESPLGKSIIVLNFVGVKH